jgi:Skp family chaperone for outer membrane proteins
LFDETLHSTDEILSAAALAAAALCAAAPAMAQEARIAAVNSERILRDSQPAKAAQVKLEQEFSKRDRELQDMAQKIKAMADKLDKDTAVLADATASAVSAKWPISTANSSASSASSARI